MKKNRTILFGGIILAVVLVSSFVVVRKPLSQNELPSLSPRSGEGIASSEYLNAQRAVEFYREQIQQKPGVVKNYTQLAQIFLQEARVTGKHHEYIPKAQFIIDQVLSREPQTYDANITKASILMTMHRFHEAHEIAVKSIAINPHNAIGYGILCDALVELGNYEQAVKACDRMLSIRPDLRSYSRASYLRELHGDAAGAVEAMMRAADAGVSGQENRAWALYNLGKLFLNQGKLDSAAYIFKGVLDERPDYAYAMSGLAQVKRAQGKLQEAVALLSKASEIVPEHLFVEQLADLYLASGEKQHADGVANIVLTMFKQHESAGWNINREYAMFCADHGMNLDEALWRISKEYESRPGNIDVLETYAWVLFKSGKSAQAIPFIERAMRLNAKSFNLLHHAALIYKAAGFPEKAETVFTRAKRENPFVNEMEIDTWKFDVLSNKSANKPVALVQ